jgi:transcription elongation factor
MLSEGLKTRLRACEEEILDLLKEKEDIENDGFDQMQELRGELLESVKEKNALEEKMDLMKHEHHVAMDELRNKVMSLEAKLSQRDRLIEDEHRKHEANLAAAH